MKQNWRQTDRPTDRQIGEGSKPARSCGVLGTDKDIVRKGQIEID